MTHAALEEIVTDAFRRHEEGDALVREVVTREGAPALVACVASLLRSRAARHGEAILFLADGLMEGREVPGVARAIEADVDLAAAFEGMLVGPNVHDRRMALFGLGRLPVRRASAMLTSAAEQTLRENEVISLAEILTTIELPDVVERLATSHDWLVRWAVLPWLNMSTSSDLAARIRGRLASDPHPLVAGEAAQHVAILERFEKAAATAQGWVFGAVSNHGPAPSFRSTASQFVQGWPAEKTSYDLEELRAYAIDPARA